MSISVNRNDTASCRQVQEDSPPAVAAPQNGDSAPPISSSGADNEQLAPEPELVLLAAVAGEPGNTPATNRQVEKEKNKTETLKNEEIDKSPEPKRTTGGLDALYVVCYGQWKIDKWVKFSQALEEAKKQSQGEDEPGCIDASEGDRFVVHPKGTSEGSIRINWILECDGIKVLVCDRASLHDTLPNLLVQVGSLTLMDIGHEAAWMQARDSLAGWGFELVKAVPSRVDLCIDLKGVPVAEFVVPYFNKHRVCLARKGAIYEEGEIYTGFSRGTDVRIRVYDKLRESLRDTAKIEVLIERRWGALPACATRVEFQVRREPLREQFQIETVEQLFAKLGTISEWLTTEWFRLTERLPDRENGHEKRAETLELWKLVQEFFRAWTSQPAEPVVARKRRCPQPLNLRQQANGCITSALAASGLQPRCPEEYLQFAAEFLRPEALKGADEEVFRKSVFWQSKGPGRGPAWSDDIPF